MIKHGKFCKDLAILHAAREHQDMYELASSFHGCQETRSWQDFQERLTMTWQEMSTIKNPIECKNKI